MRGGWEWMHWRGRRGWRGVCVCRGVYLAPIMNKHSDSQQDQGWWWWGCVCMWMALCCHWRRGKRCIRTHTQTHTNPWMWNLQSWLVKLVISNFKPVTQIPHLIFMQKSSEGPSLSRAAVGRRFGLWVRGGGWKWRQRRWCWGGF